jgi:hypothetical protein
MVDARINDGGLENEKPAAREQQEKEQKKEQPAEPPKAEILDDPTEIDLHELQIKLEKVRSYLKRTEGRIRANELNLQRLRERQQELEDKRMNVTLLPRKNKTENQV